MTETEFIQKALDLAKKGSVLVFVEESWHLEFVKRVLYVNAGLSVADAEIGISSPSDVRKLTESAMELQKLGFLISGSFDLKEKQIAKLKPDYVLDERDYRPFEVDTTLRVSAGKQ